MALIRTFFRTHLRRYRVHREVACGYALLKAASTAGGITSVGVFGVAAFGAAAFVGALAGVVCAAATPPKAPIVNMARHTTVGRTI